MNTPPANPNALVWRLTIAAIVPQLLGAVLVQAYLLLASPMADQMRELYTRPDMVVTTVLQTCMAGMLLGLTTWCSAQGWLRRHDASGVDRPGRMIAVLLAVSLVLFVLISTGLALLQHAFYRFVVNNREWVDSAFGHYGLARALLTALPLKLCGILISIVGGWLAVRIAAWSVSPVAGTGAPPYRPRHAAWIAALTLLLWQLHVGLALGGYFTTYARSPELLNYVLGYWALPALILALAAWVGLRNLPRTLGTAGFGRAIAHGTLAFWLTQLLGVGLALLVLWNMSVGQIARAAEAYSTMAVVLLFYFALVALGSYTGARLLYPRREAPPEIAPA
ncbi:hypothetical protein EC609_02875 [Achromobacter denitrificans]|nr:hypothetical protein EC609_02875 [Achromobacter denitrificans]